MRVIKKLLIATHNPGKLAEFREFLSNLPVELVTLRDAGIAEDVKETGKTYEENSRQKALFYAKRADLPTLADDGGIEIDALGGAPGVKSRRWLGKDSTDEDLIAHMRSVALNLPSSNRKARFVTVITLALPTGVTWSAQNAIDGIIAQNPLTSNIKGYPYRSFFYLPQLKKYYHENELSHKEAKEYNHRYKAVQKLLPFIKQVFEL